MSEEPREVYFEFTQIGSSVKVTAIDAASGVEVTAIGPATAAPAHLQQLALAKLKARLARESGQRQNCREVDLGVRIEGDGVRIEVRGSVKETILASADVRRARGRRGAGHHDVHGVPADRGPGPGDRQHAARTGRAAGAAHPGRAAPRRALPSRRNTTRATPWRA